MSEKYTENNVHKNEDDELKRKFVRLFLKQKRDLGVVTTR